MSHTNSKPTLGIVEPLGKVPKVIDELYGNEMNFEVVNANVQSLNVEGYERAIKEMPPKVDQLVKANVDGISIMGTSLTFYRGKDFNEHLIESIASDTNIPTTSMTSAIVKAIKVFDVKDVAVATAYSTDVTNLLANVLSEYDLNPMGLKSFDIKIDELFKIDTDFIVDMGMQAVDDSNPEALLISCGGLQTLEATHHLEERLGIPVISSSVAGAWASARLVGLSGYVENGSRLLQINKSK